MVAGKKVTGWIDDFLDIVEYTRNKKGLLISQLLRLEYFLIRMILPIWTYSSNQETYIKRHFYLTGHLMPATLIGKYLQGKNQKRKIFKQILTFQCQRVLWNILLWLSGDWEKIFSGYFREGRLIKFFYFLTWLVLTINIKIHNMAFNSDASLA